MFRSMGTAIGYRRNIHGMRHNSSDPVIKMSSNDHGSLSMNNHHNQNTVMNKRNQNGNSERIIMTVDPISTSSEMETTTTTGVFYGNSCEHHLSPQHYCCCGMVTAPTPPPQSKFFPAIGPVHTHRKHLSQQNEEISPLRKESNGFSRFDKRHVDGTLLRCSGSAPTNMSTRSSSSCSARQTLPSSTHYHHQKRSNSSISQPSSSFLSNAKLSQESYQLLAICRDNCKPYSVSKPSLPSTSSPPISPVLESSKPMFSLTQSFSTESSPSSTRCSSPSILSTLSAASTVVNTATNELAHFTSTPIPNGTSENLGDSNETQLPNGFSMKGSRNHFPKLTSTSLPSAPSLTGQLASMPNHEPSYVNGSCNGQDVNNNKSHSASVLTQARHFDTKAVLNHRFKTPWPSIQIETVSIQSKSGLE